MNIDHQFSGRIDTMKPNTPTNEVVARVQAATGITDDDLAAVELGPPTGPWFPIDCRVGVSHMGTPDRLDLLTYTALFCAIRRKETK